MAQYTIHSWIGNPRGHACWIVAELAELDYVMQQTHIADAQKPEYLAKFPQGKSPALEGPEGNLTQTHAIMRYLARKAPAHKRLLGKNVYEEGIVNQWLEFANSEVAPQWYALGLTAYGWRDFDETAVRTALSELNTKLRVLENYLKLNTYLAGHQLTIADIIMYAWLAAPMAFVLDENWRKQFGNIYRWFIHIGNNDAVRKFFGKVRVCQTVDPYGLAKKQQPKEEKKKEEKKKDQPKKKEEPKKAKKEEVEEEPVEKKEGNPLDSLPPTTFKFFDFKTLFVNAPDKNEAMDFFWKNFDANGFSIWYIKYIKYEGEGVKLYLTSNLKDSFMQRLDHFRKYGFGVHGVYGEEGNYEIRGMWVWRGLEHPQEIRDLPNYEYHTYERIDHTNEAHRQLVKEYWTGLAINESVADGLVARDVGYFK